MDRSSVLMPWTSKRSSTSSRALSLPAEAARGSPSPKPARRPAALAASLRLFKRHRFFLVPFISHMLWAKLCPPEKFVC